MKKNIIILTIVLFALIVALGAMFFLSNNPASSPAPIVKSITIQELDKNVADLDNLDTDLSASAQDDVVSSELDATLNQVGEISTPSVSLTKDEANLNSLDSDLTNLSGDEKINSEVDQSLQDVSL